MAKNKPNALVSGKEADQVSRILLGWLNQFPEKPVTRIEFEYLNVGVPSMAMSTIQAAYKTAQYILGGYRAQYQFKVVYRLQPGNSNNSRLKADEILNSLADWAVARTDKPVLGPGIHVLSIVSNTRSSLFGRYENGDEDHQILMTMTYEVNV